MATDQQKFFDQVDKSVVGFVERLAEAVRIPRCYSRRPNLPSTAHILDQMLSA